MEHQFNYLNNNNNIFMNNQNFFKNNNKYEPRKLNKANDLFQRKKLENIDNILTKKINFNTNPKNIFNNNNIKSRTNYNNINTDTNININSLNKANDLTEPLESTLTSNIYEKNITLLKEKIKEQENDMAYLNNRLKNYDEAMDQITQLNIELNKLNEIIRDKNNTIQEYREISELSKKKFEELIKNKNELVQRVKILEKENRELNKNNINKNNKKDENDDINMNYYSLKKEEYDKMKVDLYNIIQENRELKKQLQEKDYEINNLNDIIERTKSNTNFNFNNNINNNYDIDYNKIRNMKLSNNNENKFNKRFTDFQENNNNYNYTENNYNNLNNNNKFQFQERSHTPLLNNKNIPSYRKNHNFLSDYSLRTESNNNYSEIIDSFKNDDYKDNKYNYLKNKYRMKPLDYSNYLLDNLQNNLSKNYLNIK